MTVVTLVEVLPDGLRKLTFTISTRSMNQILTMVCTAGGMQCNDFSKPLDTGFTLPLQHFSSLHLEERDHGFEAKLKFDKNISKFRMTTGEYNEMLAQLHAASNTL